MWCAHKHQATPNPRRMHSTSSRKWVQDTVFQSEPEPKFTTTLESLKYIPKPPHKYGLPKIHKLDILLHPIVSYIKSGNYNLSKWISNQFTLLLNLISGSHINNTDDFLSKVKNIGLSNKKVVSFDVVSLFTNIPVTNAINYIKTEISNLGFRPNIPLDNLIKLTELCTSHCFSLLMAFSINKIQVYQ